MSITPRFARRGNHSSASPLAWSAPAGFICSKCQCVLRERVVHVGCDAPLEEIVPHVKSERAERLLKAPLQWHCNLCGKAWAVRGMHSDCDGEAADMVSISNLRSSASSAVKPS